MGKKNYRGILVPEIGEDIHAGIVDMAKSLGVVTVANSVAEARSIVETAGTVTPANPMFFSIARNLYMHDGATFQPVNETEIFVDKNATNSELTLKDRYYSVLIRSSIGAAPYDRYVLAIAVGYGRVTAGRVNLSLEISGVDAVDARFDSGSDSAANATVVNAAVIPAGTTPSITMGFRGDTIGTSKVKTASNIRLNRLYVEAKPISMA